MLPTRQVDPSVVSFAVVLGVWFAVTVVGLQQLLLPWLPYTLLAGGYLLLAMWRPSAVLG
jgi:hypothetical protein